MTRNRKDLRSPLTGRVPRRGRLAVPLLVTVACVAPCAARAQPSQALSLRPADAVLNHELRRIVGLRELSDGTLLVSDRASNSLFHVDLRAGAVVVAARPGTGPLDFTSVGPLLALGGDSTLLVDPASGRWLLFSGTRPVEVIDLPRPPTSLPIPAGADSLGHVLTVDLVSVDSAHLFLANRRTKGRRLVASYRRPQLVRSMDSTAARRVVRFQLSDTAAGEQALLFPDGWIAVARIEPFRVEWRSPAGAVVVSPALDTRSGDQDGAPPFSSVSPILMQLPNPALIAAPQGTILIHRSRQGAGPGDSYDMVDRQGKLLAIVRLNGGERIVAFGRSAVYVTGSTESGHGHLLRRHPWPP